MDLKRTDKDILSGDDILKAIAEYEAEDVPKLSRLWDYYEGENRKILDRKTPDPNNPDNKVVVPYGRKIVNTFAGYAYRPHYITYKANIEDPDATEATEQTFMAELQAVFDLNNEHIKTSRAGRNTGIFGMSYELLYFDRLGYSANAVPRFFTVDPRQMILLYDYSPEPLIKMAIRYYKITKDRYKVEVYYPDKVETYFRVRSDFQNKWFLVPEGEAINFFGEVPVVPFYMGDECQSIIEPVLSLIDAYDVLFSDSMNEFDRFAFAYLVMKKFGLTDPVAKKDPQKENWALKMLKRRRIFENVPADADIKFLTKDIPTAFIQYMSQSLRDQIHVQSHVPDFTSERMAGTSGIAIQRLMFDFENLVSSAEADFDVGLYRRIELLADVFAKLGRPTGTIDMVTISHKRNVPLNLQEFADTANTMKQAGFSSYLCADIMPDDIVPNVEEELARQKMEQEAMVGSMDMSGLDEPMAEEAV